MAAKQQTGERPHSSARRAVTHPAFISLLLVVATFTCFWPVVHADFVNYDDPDFVSENVHVKSGLTLEGVTWAFRLGHGDYWHPLTWLSLMLDATLFGFKPAGFHLTNLLLHTANAVLLFRVLLRMTRAVWRSALVAALFALHPLHVESVAWVTERKDVLCMFFGLASLWAYARYVESARSNSLSPKFWYGAALVALVCGLMSKAMLVTLPCVMLLLDYWPLRRGRLSSVMDCLSDWWPLVREKVPFFACSAAFCLVTYLTAHASVVKDVHLSFIGRWETASVGYASYLVKAFWPVNLAVPYLHPGVWPLAQVVPSTIVIVALSFGAVRVRRTYPFVFTGWFWYFGTLVPVIGLVQVGLQSMADRFTYLPLIGIYLMVVWGAEAMCAQRPLLKRFVVPVALAALAACGVLTRRQAGYWQNTETLFKHAAAVTPNNYVALNNLGGYLFERGELDSALGYYQRSIQINPHHADAINSIGAIMARKGSDAAMDWFRRALELQPDHADALFNMGNAFAKQGKNAEAAIHLERALQSRPDNFEARNNLGGALIKLGKVDEAIHQYELALRFNPDDPVVLKNLGEALAAQGKLDDAIGHYVRALRATNDPRTHYSLGMTLAVQGHWDEAIKHYSETVRLQPTNAEAQYNLGYALKIQGRADEARQHLDEAIRLKPEFPLAHYNLGCVLADQGQPELARSHLREALRLRPDYREAQQKLRAIEVSSEANP